MTEISVQDLKRRRDAGEPVVLLDVREPDEIATAKLDGATFIPMREIPARFGELPHDTPIAVLCHSGGRSGRVTDFLHANGYTNAVNVAGGIDAWSATIDPSVPRY
ncbi:rhodanese-like domain-containing protein [Vulcanimicrobium alpinum]|uniref:Rhodanese-like domain-containing protein n=1 Tax=Vulcanimicrobium alpinum TaxID=3016050 RepID=A0AAN1XUC5_UNVUL|nr:rhodanese-like domain-containing protein [Vulcanimicrobium alpinum]BDE05703.1 rhodanese-like domain-containing protein [Vulcanimicrobium alpinum]